MMAGLQPFWRRTTHNTSQSTRAKARRRRQYQPYGKEAQRRSGGFVSGSKTLAVHTATHSMPHGSRAQYRANRRFLNTRSGLAGRTGQYGGACRHRARWQPPAHQRQPATATAFSAAATAIAALSPGIQPGSARLCCTPPAQRKKQPAACQSVTAATATGKNSTPACLPGHVGKPAPQSCTQSVLERASQAGA